MSIGLIGKTIRIYLNPKNPALATGKRKYFSGDAARRANLKAKQKYIAEREAKK